MFHKQQVIALTAICGLFLFSCNNSNSGNNTDAAKENKQSANIAQHVPLTIGNVTPASPEFVDAAISIKTIKAEKAGKDSTKVVFNFNLKNYELKVQTSDKDTKMCNNSDKGQHIHFILDNQPYKALYEPTNEVMIANNSEHYLMAFLSRSYHESIKSKGAALVLHFKIDESGNLKKLEEPKTPMIFYSRPKGNYIGKDTSNVLLDYYLWNCNLSPESYKVKAVILCPKSEPFVFNLDKWESKFIQNLGATGNCKVSLQLVDKDGKNVEGPQSEVSGSINLLVDEPLKKN